VLVEFNPQEISFSDLLKVFWAGHDPGYNTSNRQYRNVIFYLNDEQQKRAEQTRDEVAATLGVAVQTVIEPAGDFYPAEDYHQKYYLRQNRALMAEFNAIYPDAKQFAASTAAARVNGYLGCYGTAEDLTREIGLLGLSPAAQRLLVEHLSANCSRFKGVTCPAPK